MLNVFSSYVPLHDAPRDWPAWRLGAHEHNATVIQYEKAVSDFRDINGRHTAAIGKLDAATKTAVSLRNSLAESIAEHKELKEKYDLKCKALEHMRFVLYGTLKAIEELKAAHLECEGLEDDLS